MREKKKSFVQSARVNTSSEINKPSSVTILCVLLLLMSFVFRITLFNIICAQFVLLIYMYIQKNNSCRQVTCAVCNNTRHKRFVQSARVIESTHTSLNLSLSICLSVCPSVRLFVCLSVCLSVYSSLFVYFLVVSYISHLNVFIVPLNKKIDKSAYFTGILNLHCI